MENIVSKTDYAVQTPTEPERPAYNFSGNLFQPKLKNRNIPQIVGAITPENKVESKPRKINTFITNMFWPDDNPDQNPVDKLKNSEFETNPKYEVSLFRVGPHQEDILEVDDMKKFKFSDQLDDTPEATRPRNFNDFFN